VRALVEPDDLPYIDDNSLRLVNRAAEEFDRELGVA
jgi:hypothetical protein